MACRRPIGHKDHAARHLALLALKEGFAIVGSYFHRRTGYNADLGASYAESHLTATVAAASGFIDEVIAPEETRARLAWALGSLEDR